MTDYSSIASLGVEAQEQAQEARKLVKSRFGLLFFAPRFVVWSGDKEDRVKTEIPQSKFNPKEKGHAIEYVFTLKQTKQDGEAFETERAVTPSSPDWEKIGLPSIARAYGFEDGLKSKDKEARKAAIIEGLGRAFAAMEKGVLAELLDTPQTLSAKKAKEKREAEERGEEFKTYSTFHLARVFADKASYNAAMAETYKRTGEGEPVSTIIYPPTPQEDKENGAYTHAQWDAQIPTVQKYLRLGYTPEQIAGEGKLPNGKFGFGVPVECIIALVEEQVPA